MAPLGSAPDNHNLLLYAISRERGREEEDEEERGGEEKKGTVGIRKEKKGEEERRGKERYKI